MESIIEKLKEQVRKSWDGQKIGEQQAIELEEYLRKKLDEYSSVLGVSKKEILESWEKERNYSVMNYYQEANQPSLKGERVKVFDTVEELFQSIGEKKFRCPACEGVTTNPYVCDSGKEVSEGKVCDWKVYGFFGDLGKGFYVYVKNQLKGETIFSPIAWESKENELSKKEVLEKMKNVSTDEEVANTSRNFK